MGIGRVLERYFDVPHFRFGEAEPGGPAEFDHIGVIAGKGELVPLQQQLAASARDLKTVRARGFAGGGDERAGRAARIFKVSGDVIFDFDLMETPKLAEAADA